MTLDDDSAAVDAGAAPTPTPSPKKRGKLRITLELDVRRMTRREAGDESPVPFLDEYTPVEIGQCMAWVLEAQDTQAEAFAGSGVFVTVRNVALRDAVWDGDA